MSHETPKHANPETWNKVRSENTADYTQQVYQLNVLLRRMKLTPSQAVHAWFENERRLRMIKEVCESNTILDGEKVKQIQDLLTGTYYAPKLEGERPFLFDIECD